jgi:hypothetical protein
MQWALRRRHPSLQQENIAVFLSVLFEHAGRHKNLSPLLH